MINDTRTAKEFAQCINSDGSWKVRDDVWIYYNEGTPNLTGDLSVGFGFKSNKIGPEYGFGFSIGDAIQDQVLLIKTAWGGKSLAGDFRPPSSGGTVGPYYTEMIELFHGVLKNLTNLFPKYEN